MAVFIEDYIPVVKYNGLNTAKATSLGSTLAVTGAATFSSTINITGATTLASLAVTGTSTLTGTVAIVGTTSIAGEVTVSTGSLTVSLGNVALSGTNSSLAFGSTNINGGLLVNLWNTASTALSGTQRDVKVILNGTAYYFTVYPTKA